MYQDKVVKTYFYSGHSTLTSSEGKEHDQRYSFGQCSLDGIQVRDPLPETTSNVPPPNNPLRKILLSVSVPFLHSLPYPSSTRRYVVGVLGVDQQVPLRCLDPPVKFLQGLTSGMEPCIIPSSKSPNSSRQRLKERPFPSVYGRQKVKTRRCILTRNPDLTKDWFSIPLEFRTRP